MCNSNLKSFISVIALQFTSFSSVIFCKVYSYQRPRNKLVPVIARSEDRFLSLVKVNCEKPFILNNLPCQNFVT